VKGTGIARFPFETRAPSLLFNADWHPTVGLESTMLVDALVALLITAVAVILGLTVHPLLFFVIALAVLYLFVRSPRSSRRPRSRTRV
jgi:Flp pilus assembly protein TadB